MARQPIQPIWPRQQPLGLHTQSASPAETGAAGAPAQTRHRRSLDKPWERCAHHPVLPNVWACPACFMEMRELHRALIERLRAIRSGQLSAEQIQAEAQAALEQALVVYLPLKQPAHHEIEG